MTVATNSWFGRAVVPALFWACVGLAALAAGRRGRQGLGARLGAGRSEWDFCACRRSCRCSPGHACPIWFRNGSPLPGAMPASPKLIFVVERVIGAPPRCATWAAPPPCRACQATSLSSSNACCSRAMASQNWRLCSRIGPWRSTWYRRGMSRAPVTTGIAPRRVGGLLAAAGGGVQYF